MPVKDDTLSLQCHWPYDLSSISTLCKCMSRCLGIFDDSTVLVLKKMSYLARFHELLSFSPCEAVPGAVTWWTAHALWSRWTDQAWFHATLTQMLKNRLIWNCDDCFRVIVEGLEVIHTVNSVSSRVFTWLKCARLCHASVWRVIWRCGKE